MSKARLFKDSDLVNYLLPGAIENNHLVRKTLVMYGFITPVKRRARPILVDDYLINYRKTKD